jgi:phospholipid-transporting ATPase
MTMDNNNVRTAKYTVWDFVPKNLFNQFKKLANCYFLIITYMQTVKSISISNGTPAMAFPLTVIILISMAKDAYEDRKRHVADAEENDRDVEVYDNTLKKFVTKMWREIRVGNIVKVNEGEMIPADMITL